MTTDYLSRTEKSITLPSGATVVIRKWLAADFRGISRGVPMIDAPAKDKKPDAPISDSEFDLRVKITHRMLTACTSQFTFNGKVLRIVDKPFAQKKDGELPIEQLEDADALAIVKGIEEFSGWTEGGGQNGQTFRADANGDTGPSGEEIRAVPA